MKLTNRVIMTIVGVVAVFGGTGIGLAIGAGIWSSSTFSTNNSDATKKAIKALFNVKRAIAPTVQQDKLETYNKATNFPVALVPDGAGVINDKSFNEQTGDGVLDIYGEKSGSEGSIADHSNLYRRPKDSNMTIITTIYDTLYKEFRPIDKSKKKVIIAPGYGHPDAIESFWESKNAKTKYEDLYFVLLDQSKELFHTLCIEFDVSSTAFKAGYLSALFLEKIGDASPKVGLWGGGKFLGVTSFMRGYVSGIKYYNDHTISRKVEIVKFSNDKDYVNSGFATGGGRQKADFLISKGADVILPVAGTQTGDLISAINASKRKKEVKIVGVDTDQSMTYEENKDLFLTSITKNLRKAAYEGYKAIKGNSTSITYDENNHSFVGTIANGYSSYVKQFDATQNNNGSIAWKEIYQKVDSIDLSGQVLSWPKALEYIKKQT